MGLGARLLQGLGGARGQAKQEGWGSGLDFSHSRRSAVKEASQKEVQGGTSTIFRVYDTKSLPSLSSVYNCDAHKRFAAFILYTRKQYKHSGDYNASYKKQGTKIGIVEVVWQDTSSKTLHYEAFSTTIGYLIMYSQISQ